MKIAILKKGTKKLRAMEPCPYFVDCPPDGVDVRKPSNKE